MPETVRRGSSGPAVREAQYLLARRQYLGQMLSGRSGDRRVAGGGLPSARTGAFSP
jgi:hypothetical protein